MLKSLTLYSIGYGIILTIYSMIRFQIHATRNQLLNSFFGIAILLIIYLYLNWSLKKLHSNIKLSKRKITLIGFLVTTIGCTLSTTTLWFYNEHIGLINNISNSTRAIVVNGIIGLIVSIIITSKLPKNKN